MEITLQLRFVFVRHSEVFLLHLNYVIYLFDEITFFDDGRITLCSGTFVCNQKMTKKYVITYVIC